MSRLAIKTAWRPRAILPLALAYLLALNSLLASFGSVSGAAIGRDQGSALANVICAAAAAASGNGVDHGAPGKGHTHHSHHCILCCASGIAAAPCQTAIIPAIVLPPERSPGVARPSARSTAPPLSSTGFLSSRSTRAPPLTV